MYCFSYRYCYMEFGNVYSYVWENFVYDYGIFGFVQFEVD